MTWSPLPFAHYLSSLLAGLALGLLLAGGAMWAARLAG